MGRDETMRILEESRDELRRREVSSLWLFGSVARDQASAGSDVDLLVAFEGSFSSSGNPLLPRACWAKIA